MRVWKKKKKERVEMGIGRRHVVVLCLGLLMVLGIAVYSRLWAIDYKISTADSEFLRRQFDLAHREAVDESAEWRLRFDQERERSSKCVKELTEVKKLVDTKNEDIPGVDDRVQRLQKENKQLLGRLQLLKQELENVKLKCTAP